MFSEVKRWNLAYRFESPKFGFESQFQKVFSEVNKWGLQIRILEVWIRIPILESFLNSEKVKFGLWIRIPKEWIRILSVKATDKSWICTPTKIGIFFHVPNVFWIWLFMKKNEDMVKILRRWSVPDRFKLIYHLKIWSKESDKISFPKRCRKPNVKGYSNHLSSDLNPYSRMSRK